MAAGLAAILRFVSAQAAAPSEAIVLFKGKIPAQATQVVDPWPVERLRTWASEINTVMEAGIRFTHRSRNCRTCEAAAVSYGTIRSVLEKRGSPIGPLDTLIAGHALSLGWTLVTHNTHEFKRVAGLSVEDWLASA